MSRPSPGLLLGGLLTITLAMPATALAGPTVSVRVEGQAATLVSKQVTLPDAPTSANAAACGPPSASSAFEALDAATGGDWDRSPFASTVLGETHTFADSDYWAVWIGRAGGFLFGGGLCDDILQAGDELLMLVDVAPAPSYASTVFPLAMRGVPATVRPGEPFTVRVDEYQPENGTPGTGKAGTADGVEVTGGSSSAKTVGGAASITLTERGEAILRATRAGTRARPLSVCVTDGGDGFCGTPVCATDAAGGFCGATPPQNPAPGAPSSPAPAADRAPALARIAGIREQQVFARGKGPRELRGTVDADPSGIKEVRLRLTRTVRVSAPGRVRVRGRLRSRLRTRCSRFDLVTERLRTMSRCGAGRARFHPIGSQANWTYLLPARLPRGRYVLDTQTVDGAGNATRGATRGKPGEPRNRVVFHVR